MTFDLQKMLESKRAYRAQLAAKPIGEKLRILDLLRERQKSIRGNAAHSESTVLPERTGSYREGKK